MLGWSSADPADTDGRVHVKLLTSQKMKAVRAENLAVLSDFAPAAPAPSASAAAGQRVRGNVVGGGGGGTPASCSNEDNGAGRCREAEGGSVGEVVGSNGGDFSDGGDGGDT